MLSIALLGRLGVTIVYAIITLYTVELFPTEIRNSAVGASSMCGHIGSMIAPFVVDFTVCSISFQSSRKHNLHSLYFIGKSRVVCSNHNCGQYVIFVGGFGFV